MKSAILDIAVQFPSKVLDNKELIKSYPDGDIELAARRCGVHRRYIASQDETALDLAFYACQKLMKRQPELQSTVDMLLFCTQTPDYRLPSNACVLHGKLGLPEKVGAFDMNLACSGFTYALGVSHGMIESGIARNVLIVTADTYSKYIHEQDRSTRILFGDGAAATWVGPGEEQSGIRDITWGTDGKLFHAFMIPAGACRNPSSAATREERIDKSGNVRTYENIHMDGKEILKFTFSKIPIEVRKILDRNALSIEEIDLFVFHQASSLVLDNLTQLLGLSPSKVFRNLDNIGNTVSASIPMGLCSAFEKGIISRGDQLLLCGFGAGLSWATVLLNF